MRLPLPSFPRTPAAQLPHQATPGRAVRVVLYALGAFVLLQVGLAVWLEDGGMAMRDPEFAAHLKRLLASQNRRDHPSLVLMLGSSRTQLGLKAVELQQQLTRNLGRPVAAHNFGCPGAGGVSQLFTWDRLRRNGVHPALVLVEVHPGLLNARYPNMELSETRLPTSRLSRSDLRDVERFAGSTRPNLDYDWWSHNLAPVITYRHRLCRLCLPWMLPKDDQMPELNETGDPVVAIEAHTSEQKAKALARAYQEYEQGYSNYSVGGAGGEAIEELLADCRTHGIDTILVLMPEGPAFRGWFSQAPYDDCRAWMRRVADSTGATIVDAREWFDEEAFFDSHHMTPPGASRFTERLGREAILPRLRSR
jgi:hypothetical protein